MKTLFDIGHDLTALAALLEETDGEIGPEADEAVQRWIAEIEQNRDTKLENYRKLIVYLESRAAVARSEEDQYRKMRQTAESQIKWLKGNIKAWMEYTHQVRVETATGHTFSIQDNGGKLGIDFSTTILPEHYKESPFVKTTYEWSQDAVRGELDAGHTLEFARYKDRGTQLRIR